MVRMVVVCHACLVYLSFAAYPSADIMCNYISGENSKEESNIFHHGFTSFWLRSQIVTVHSVHSNLAKIHSRLPAAMEFWLVCLGILAYSCQNTSRDSGVWTVTNCPFYILIDIHSSLFLSFLRWYRQDDDRSNYKQSSKHHLFFGFVYFHCSFAYFCYLSCLYYYGFWIFENKYNLL